MSHSRSSVPAPQHRFPVRTNRRRLPLWAAALLGTLLLALVVSACSGSSNADGNRPGADTKEKVEVSERVTVDGDPLVAFSADDEDSAVGERFPTITSVGPDGEEVTVGGDVPVVVAVVAHWCPHCQKEIPVIQAALDSGEWPEGVNVAIVSTAADEAKGNWSPSEWLSSEGVTSPVLVDDKAATAFHATGASGFPFLVGVDKDGTVQWRHSGEMSAEDLISAASELAPTATPPGDS